MGTKWLTGLLILGTTPALAAVSFEIVPSGTSDDTGTIQDALDLLEDGDTLKLKGDFFIADTIYLPSNFKWVLDGTLTLADDAD